MLYRPPVGRLGREQLLRRVFAAQAFHDLGRRLADWQRRRDDAWRLSNLDDRLLADIGIRREDVAARVKGGR
jgi:uncharacterized protein YjiS (DUF1127 family)